VVTDSSGRIITLGRNVSLVIEDEQGHERAVHKLTQGSRLFVNEGDKIKRGTRLAEWDPYTLARS
jgi:DNA-directed RNA polymerase subunit beta'